MAWLIKRGAYWHASWKQDGKTVRKSTGIPWEEHGKSAKQLRRTAEAQAKAMELLAKGRSTLDVAQDALRAVAVANGMSKAVPSVVGLLDREAFSVEEMKIILTQFPEMWRDMAAVSYYCHGLRLSDVSL